MDEEETKKVTDRLENLARRISTLEANVIASPSKIDDRALKVIAKPLEIALSAAEASLEALEWVQQKLFV